MKISVLGHAVMKISVLGRVSLLGLRLRDKVSFLYYWLDDRVHINSLLTPKRRRGPSALRKCNSSNLDGKIPAFSDRVFNFPGQCKILREETQGKGIF